MCLVSTWKTLVQRIMVRKRSSFLRRKHYNVSDFCVENTSTKDYGAKEKLVVYVENTSTMDYDAKEKLIFYVENTIMRLMLSRKQ